MVMAAFLFMFTQQCGFLDVPNVIGLCDTLRGIITLNHTLTVVRFTRKQK